MHMIEDYDEEDGLGMAILINQKAEVKWSNRNATYYLDLGYPEKKPGETFYVELKDLSKGSHVLIKVICDYCDSIFNKKFSSMRNTKNHFCSNKCKDNFLIGKPSWNDSKITTNCSYCNKEIKRPKRDFKRSKNLFCSVQCANNFQKGRNKKRYERIILKCEHCSEEIKRTEKELDRADNHFCSKSCSDKFSKGKVNLANRGEWATIVCQHCKEYFNLPRRRINNVKNNFCSNSCRISWMQSENYEHSVERTGVIVNCCSCDKEIYRKPSISSNKTGRFYCSIECKNSDIANWNLPQSQKGELVLVKCHNCDEEISVLPSVYKKNKYFYCSTSCYHNIRLATYDYPLTKTTIHKKINDVLDEMNIKYKDEYPLLVYSVDIYLPTQNLIIEVMGDYWHSNPLRHNDISEVDRNRIKDIIKDKRKHRQIKRKFGIDILYLWEEDINNRLDLCVELIKLYINSKGKLKDYNSFNYCLKGEELTLNVDIVLPYFLRDRLK
ncbi:hypothetical protein [Siminovitchia fordii]|uniref:TRASH domain-containing protein n=1 Tax=Siminovitchia fordii TaxID=254759 RepID=A0ABQ4KBJ8_9BACI|nr:hypothetical protein [Siminovitchia fordii]GIN23125.1 hypothetical protein J1TS3_42590 [Siminovitchia fordii]